MASSGYTLWSVVAGEQPTTAKWNILGNNDASFNSGVGFNDGVIGTRLMKPNYAQSTVNNNGTGTRSVGTSNYNVPGVSITYTTGVTNEMIYIFGSALLQSTAGGSGLVIQQGGANVTRRTYTEVTNYLTHYPKGVFLANANTTYTFVMVVIPSGTSTICNSNTDAAQNFHPSLELIAWSR
jgi:hypothetical protein